MTAALLKLNARTFASLKRHRNYRLFFTGQLVSVIGTWMQNIALAWLVIELTSSPVAVGILAFCRFVPFTVFGLFAGVVADRVENRKLVIGTQLVSMLLSAILTVVVLTGSATLWLVYVLAALGGCALVFDAPGRHALTFQLVGRDELSNAVALNASLFNASRVVGPSLAGVLIAAFGVGACFAINTVSFLAVLTSLLLMRQEELVPVKRDAEPPSMLRSIGEGLRYARVTPEVRLILAIVTVVSTVGFNFHVILPLLASETLDTGPEVFGILSACFGAGALVGALLTRRARPGELEGPRRRNRRLQPHAARNRPARERLGLRDPPLRHRRLLHALDVERERDPPARRARSPARPRRQPLPLGLRRARAARRPPRRLPHGRRRNAARIPRLRSHRARDDADRRPPPAAPARRGERRGFTPL